MVRRVHLLVPVAPRLPGHVRRPLLPISDEERSHLADVLREVGLLREPVSAGQVD